MTLLVCGSRGWSDHLAIRTVLQRFLEQYGQDDLLVLTGGARGADRLAFVEAHQLGIHVAEIVPLWQRYGKKAGFMRNRWLVRLADEMVSFWDGDSPGTLSTIQLCTASGVPFTIHEQDGGEVQQLP